MRPMRSDIGIAPARCPFASCGSDNVVAVNAPASIRES